MKESKMDDDELKRLFEGVATEKIEKKADEKSPVKGDGVDVPKSPSNSVLGFKATTKRLQKGFRRILLKLKEQKDKTRDRSKKEKTIKTNKGAFEVKIDSKNASVPLSKREYLPAFPLSFSTVLKILFAIAIVMAIVDFIYLPCFRIGHVTVTGNAALSTEEILDEAGIEIGGHLLSGISGNVIDVIKLNYGKTEARMMAENPYIEDITIGIDFPSGIKITIKEREKIAYVSMPDGYAAIDSEGTVLELCTLNTDDEPHAVICGLNVTSAIIGEKIKFEDEDSYEKAIALLGAILASDINSGDNSDDSYMMFSNVTELRMTPGGYIFLTLKLPSGSYLQVKIADITSRMEDMAWLRYAITQNAFDNLPNGALDMTGDEYIYREYA